MVSHHVQNVRSIGRQHAGLRPGRTTRACNIRRPAQKQNPAMFLSAAAMPFADHVSAACCSRDTLHSLQDLGYAAVCWTTEAAGSVPAKPPKLATGGASATAVATSSFTRLVHECTRLTLSLDEESHAFALTGAREALRAFDVVAVAPASELILERVLQSPVSDVIDIVCFPSAHRPPFNLRPALARRVLGAGMFFELCYSAALRDSSSRRHFVSNLQSLLEALPKGGKRGTTGLLLSSGADEARLLRTPHDALALVGAFGCGRDAAKLALADNHFKVLERAARRQLASCGAIPPATGLHSLGPLPCAAARLTGKRAAGPDSVPPSSGAVSGKPKRPRR
jgi:ribonuclease P/MRP protein subunit RPP1